ncbi:extracellular matrix-binding ebh, putative [Babesia caballi]|uniref:Extracellular matrix-binding ebh, putative n=1 Tax=Babesia caballi TaxID=5871 RepID=A0AAV4LZW3_BABCB|nr:extracellular matrix-binding ebh, putative [Babesia caballi]
MNFLYWQCSDNGRRCGWQYCTFGSAFTPQKESEVVTSHLCHADCDSHKSSKCVDHAYYSTTKCGQSPNQSPLQAFLTDCLSGFCRKLPGSASDHLTTCSGPCHVPMGFEAKHLRGVTKIGRNIMSALIPFCASDASPLRHLSEKLSCLTKRAPRSLGDLFGFIWHLNGQLFGSKEPKMQELAAKLYEPFKSGGRSHNIPQFLLGILKTLSTSSSASQSASVLSKSLEYIAPVVPFLYEIFMVKDPTALPVTLYNLKGTTHGSSSVSHANLYSLYNPQCTGQTCGQYIRPLCYSNGATYASRHASSYLSWVLYLSDDLSVSFGEMLDEFNNIDCTKANCKYFSTGQKCSVNHQLGNHGSSDVDCKCDSVVECGGTLPVLYSHSFNFHNAFVLMGGTKGGTDYSGPTKRSCENFHSALTNVLSPDAPLDKLINTIDTFLYVIRWEFFSKLSGFWTIYVCIILYTFFFLLDTLHLRSHLKLTSHVPPLALLTSGKPLPITKLTYIGQ